MNHLQLQQAALPDLSVSKISRLPKDQLAHFSNAVQQLNDWTVQMRGRIWQVSFMGYDLGFFDMDSCRVEPGPNPFGPRVLTM